MTIKSLADRRLNKPAEAFQVARIAAAAGLSSLAKVSFAAMVVVLPIRYRWVLVPRPIMPVYKDYTDLLLFPGDVALGLMLICWLLSLLARPRRIERGPRFLFWPLAGLTLAGFVSVTYSVDPVLSLYHSIRQVLLLGLYLYVVNEIKSLRMVAWPVMGQVFVQSLVGIAQFLSQRSVGLESLGEYTLDPSWKGVSVVVADGDRILRAYGLTDHPNILGGCLALSLLLIAAWYLASKVRWSAWVGGVFAMGAVGLLLTFSRSAWAAFLGGGLLAAVLLLTTRHLQIAQRWLGLMLAGLIAILPFVWSRFDEVGVRLNLNNSFTTVAAEDQALGERNLLNGLARSLWARRLWTGVGLGAFPIALHQQAPGYPFNYQPPHHVLLEAASELGVLGAALYFAAVVGPWIMLVMRRRRLIVSPTLIGVSGLLLAVTVIGFFDYYTWLIVPGRLWQWLIWGMWGRVYQSAGHYLEPARGERICVA
jgi:O-antigen ligase